MTHDVSQTPTVLTKPVLYSDPAALLNRGWVEMEISLALVFGVEVLVSQRWGPKVSADNEQKPCVCMRVFFCVVRVEEFGSVCRYSLSDGGEKLSCGEQKVC